MCTLETLKRFKPGRAQLISGSLVLSAGMLAYAVPNVFTAGTTLSAAQMNANFTDVEARIAALEAKLASVTVTTSNGQPTVRFTGVNVQVVNGQDATASANGTGNLIVGYNEADTSGTSRCTLGRNPNTNAGVTDAATCSAAGGTWTNTGFKTGSHYIVAGSQNNYSRWGGLLVGFGNTSNYDYASVSGGWGNIASGQYASVSGGQSNTASGQVAASVSGGWSNNASGTVGASVSGGSLNTANGASAASVSGGQSNTAGSDFASVSGGQSNIASAQAFASVSGGSNNRAFGYAASVSGGESNTAASTTASVSGGQSCSTGAVTNKWIVGQSGTAACSATLGN